MTMWGFINKADYVIFWFLIVLAITIVFSTLMDIGSTPESVYNASAFPCLRLDFTTYTVFHKSNVAGSLA